MSWAEKRASYLKSEKKEAASPASAKSQDGWAEKRQSYLQKQEEINSIDWNEVSAGLKKDLADVLGGGNFDKDKSRELVEDYAGVQFRIFDENLKKGRTAIKPVGENLSNLFKAHGYDFNELYPDLAENFATGNIEGYAYQNSDKFKEEWDKREESRVLFEAKAEDADILKLIREINDIKSVMPSVSDLGKGLLFDKEALLTWNSGKATESRLNEKLEELNKKLEIRKQVTGEDITKYNDYINEYSFGQKVLRGGKWLGTQIDAGLAQASENVVATADVLLPTELLGKYDFLSKAHEYYKKNTEGYQNRAIAKTNEMGGGGWQTAGELIQAAATAAPDMMVALSSGGTSLFSKGGIMAKEAATTIPALFKNVAKKLVSNPTYWTSAINTLGRDYEEAKSRGASDIEATFVAFLTTAINSGIEVGGVQDLPRALKTGGVSAGIEFVRSTLDEGREEVLQKIVSNTVAMIYDENVPLFSMEDETAIINPKALAKDFGMGVGVGAILGGGPATVNAVSQSSQLKAVGSRYNNPYGIDVIIEEGKKYSYSTEVSGLIEKIQNAKKTTDKDVGELYFAIEEERRKSGNNFYNELDSAESMIRDLEDPVKTEVAKKLMYKGGAFSEIYGLIKQGESTSYIADKIVEQDGSVTKDEAIAAVEELKRKEFASSLRLTNANALDKANAIKRYTLKEQALDRMYKLGESGLEYDYSMAADLASEADAFKAYTRGENARMLSQGQSTEVGSIDFSGENLETSSNVTPEKSSGKSINDYIDYSIEYGKTLRENPDADIKKQNSSKVIGSVSERLINDIVSDYGVDLSGKVHALIDNDIRHIINSHGEGTNEKYPVTANDLKQIPDIVENYDDVLYLPRKDGKKGIIYVKQHNGITYYLESIQNDNMLRNKQMIKVSTGTIPDLPGLEDAINTKWKQNRSFPDDKIPQMYGFPVRTAVPTDNIISDSSPDVNTVINSIGSKGTALYNRILEPIAKDTKTKQNLVQYREGFAHVYESGLKGVPYKRSKASPLTLKQINAVYEAGKKDAQARAKVKKKANAKVIKDDSFTKAKVSKRTERILGGVAKIVGRDIRFSDDIEGNAKIDLATGEIIISTKAKSGHTWAMIHEVYHALVVDSPAEAAVLKKTVLDIARKNPALYKKLRGIYADRYIGELLDENGKLRADAEEYLTEEMAADLIGYTLSDPEILESLTGEQRNVLQKFVDKLISMFGDKNLKAASEYLSNADADIRAVFKDVAKEADVIAEQFRAAIEKQAEMQSPEATKKTSTGEVRMSRDISGVDFVKNKYFDRKIDKWNELKEDYVTAGTIKENSVLNRVGVPAGKIYYDVSKIKKGYENHSDHITVDVLKAVPEVLNDPMVITEYKPGQNTNTISIYGNLILKGKPVVVGLVVTPGRGGNVVSKIRTVHLRKDLKNQITEDSILYLKNNKKEINAWYQAYIGIDVPRGGTQLGVIRSIDFINSISKDKENVNRNSRDIFTKADEEYLKLAENPEKNKAELDKAVAEAAKEWGAETDSQGNPIVLYHGTDNFGFTSIDTKYSDDELTFWATSAQEVASSYEGTGNIRAIGKPAPAKEVTNLDPATDSAEKIVKTASELLPRYKKAIFSERGRLKTAKKHIASALRSAKKLLGSDLLTKGDAKAVETFVSVAKSNDYNAILKASDECSRIFESMQEDETEVDTFVNFADTVHDFLYPENVIINGNIEYASDIAIEYNRELREKGIYKLYYKADNPYVIDCKGVSWNEIVPPSEISPDGSLKNTREIARWAFEHGYDSVKYENAIDMGPRAEKNVPATVWAFMKPEEQIKSADNVTYDDDGNVIPLSERFNPDKNDIRWSKDVFSEDGVRRSKGLSGEDEKYSYSTLISKPDMKLTIVDEAVPDNRADIIEQAKKNASAVGIVDKTTKAISVYVDDIGDSVIIGAKGLQHGLRRKSTLQTDATSIVTLKAGEIIKNSIRINELTPKYDNVDSAYALIGAAKNSNGDLYIVESVVNRFNNELVSMEVLYSVNAKKENRLSSMLPRIQPPVTDSTISIADLLQYVNRYFPDVLSESVLRQFGYTERPSGALGESVLYSKELFTDDRTMSAEEIENDEIEQMVQSIISSDDLSDADVKAIREEIINSKKQIREKLLADITTTNLARWGMDIGRSENAPKMSIDEAVKKVKDSFGITITDAKDASVTGSAVSSYNESTRTIRTKFRNDLPAICHSLGYHIDNTLGVVDKVIEQTAKVRELDGDGVSEWEQELRRLSNYEGDDTRKAIKEGFAEFIRLYLVSKNLAQADAPIFYSEFESMLQDNEKLQNAVETSAEAVSGYFVQSAEDRGSGAIMTKAEWDKLNKESLGKRLKSTQTRLIQAVTDSFYAIKATEKAHGVFDLTTSDTGYVKASMTRTSRSRAARILMDAFYDADGNRIGDSFLDIIKPLGKENSKKMEDFGDYLTFVHAIEWIEPNKLEGKKTSSGKDIYNAKAKGYVFKDATLNDANELRRIVAGMEERHPDFKAIAKKVYEYQDNLMKYYLIPSGALSQDQAETFRAQYPHYVPFNRFNSVFGDATGKRNRSLFANLRNPIQKADGGDAPIRNPIESIMNSTYAAVDFYDKQATMAAIASEFAGMNAIPGVMSRIYSTKQLQELEDKGKNPFSIEEGKTLDENKDASFNPVADKEKGIVYRWVNGEKWFYQVYDRDLFNALSSLDVEQLTKGFRFLNTMSNILKRTMTMWNPIFSTGNAIKDFQSFKKNTVTNAGVLGSLGMYVSSAKSFITQDEYFRLYRAMGGMDSTRLNADEDSIRKAVRGGVRKNTRLFSPSEMHELWKYSKHEWFKRVDLVRNLVDSFFAFNDFIETMPRLAEFKNSMNMSESKGDAQLAFYRSQDVTTDFSRKGTQGRKINAVFLFSNANLQGIDKSIRTYTEAKYTRKNAKGELSNANIAKKVISNLTFDLLVTALMAFLHRDEEDREEYRRLSDFTKNNYYCFHTGDGNFIKIPKGENSSLPQTLTQSLWDASQGDDIDLSELGGYVWECFFPDFIPNAFDVFTEDSVEEGARTLLNTPFNKTPVSVFTDVVFNRDYKGDEIVPSYMGNYENNFEKYTGSTSKFSVDLAEKLFTSAGIDISPMSLDHFFGAAGWYGSFATKMMPAVSNDGNETFGEKFWNAFGLERKFTADARYSTDLLNDFYDERDKIADKIKAKPTSKNLIQNEKYQAMSSFMSGYNKASRNGSEEQQRLDRRMLQMMLEDFGEGDYTEGEEYVMKLYDSTKNDKVFKTTFPKAEFTANVKVGKKKVKKEVSLDANTYAQFCADISNMREKVRILVRDMGLDDVTAASFLEGAYTDIDADMKIKYAEMYGKDPVAVEDSSKKTEVSKQDQNWFDNAYEEALNNEIWK